jgi:N-acetylglucosamine-6-phosphate deacetylase
MVGPGGLIDVQVNGAGGFDLTGEPEAVWPVGAILAGFGVGAFVPTLVSPAYEVVDRALAALAAGPPPGYAGATPLGWHVEGPFLNPARAGAHDPSALKTPDRGAARGWSRDAGVRMVTIAPELPGALDLVTELLARGVVVSAGHSDATIEQARAGFDAGITAVTHLFNAMPRLDHRAPGLVGAALADERISIGLIVDGVHLHPTVVDLVWRICGPDRLVLVSDAIDALGMPPGRYRLAGRDVDVDVEAGTARLEDGTLAGCIVPVRDSVANLAAAANVPVEVARRAATVNPARLLGLGLGLGLE